MSSSKRHRATITIFSFDRGGRPAMPMGSGYSPDACLPGGREYLPIVIHDVPVTATFNMAFEANIEFRYSDPLDYSAILSGLEFVLIEGTKRIGTATLKSSSG
jgi:hypothetical protein